MKAITPKFNVGDKLRHKHNSNNEKNAIEYLVIQVDTATCIAGTQIMYGCRLLLTKHVESSPIKESFLYKEAAHNRELLILHEFEVEKA